MCYAFLRTSTIAGHPLDVPSQCRPRLDRKQRLIFTLGAILGASDTVGAEVLEMTSDNFRQCLVRARRDLHSFMNQQCGLVNKGNPCRCPKKT